MATTKKKTTTAKRTARKKTTRARGTKGRATTKKTSAAKTKRTSALDAAAKVLREKKSAMTCRELIDVMSSKGYWESPAGKTPHATLSAALQREIKTKGREARFKKAARGKFSLQA